MAEELKQLVGQVLEKQGVLAKLRVSVICLPCAPRLIVIALLNDLQIGCVSIGTAKRAASFHRRLSCERASS